MTPRRYCLGFCFDPEGKHVVLIRKNRPDWAKGLLNGLGGEINPEEPLEEAMAREFQEECGLFVRPWREFGVMTGGGREVHLMTARFLHIEQVRQTTDEAVVVMPTRVTINPRLLVPSVSWMIPLALDRNKHVFIHSTRKI
jgi:8-oxo-dGTP pyrophosphatase MutT (NUDIX family)